MKDRFASVPVIVLGALIIALALYGTLSALNDDNADFKRNDIDRLENAIIIEGLEMESDSPPLEEEDDEFSGLIIRDDHFMQKKPHESSGENKMAGRNSSESIMKELRAKDGRWHKSKYTIKRGDNLWSIAKKFGTDHRLIIEINQINNPDILKPGRNIQVPNRNGVFYTVKKGDNLSVIASRYKSKIDTISSHNNVAKYIQPGTKLFVPDGVAPQIRQIAKQKAAAPRSVVESAKKQSGKTLFAWPARGRITSSFGNRIDPFSKRKRFHTGIDISLYPGTPVKAAATGTVIFSGWKNGYGNTVVIRHQNGYITVYAHNKSNQVKEGDVVRQGQLIALSGMTGLATGGHLHFEVRKYLTPLNPLRMLR